MGGKLRAKQFFQKHTNSDPKKVEKKIVGKKLEKRFYIRTNTVFTNGGEKRAKQFFHKQKKSAAKKCWGKNRRKKVRNASFIFAQLL